MGFFHIPEDILMKMTKKQLVEDLVMRFQNKGNTSKSDLQLILRQNYPVDIVVMIPTQ